MRLTTMAVTSSSEGCVVDEDDYSEAMPSCTLSDRPIIADFPPSHPKKSRFCGCFAQNALLKWCRRKFGKPNKGQNTEKCTCERIAVSRANWEYCRPYGIIKAMEIAVGVAFVVFALPRCLFAHCYDFHRDWLLWPFLTGSSLFAVLGSIVFLFLHLLRPDGIAGIFNEKWTLLKLIECAHVAVSAALYFVVRYYCANYYGAVKNLRDRWVVMLALSWTLVVLYIIESFVVLGINIRCGGHVTSLRRNAVEQIQPTHVYPREVLQAVNRLI